ncbi:hypothetical protein GcC1_157015, partial [Golovinomyces cichoracearum]
HRKPDCRSRALEYWEQNYLKDIVFNNVSSNFAGSGDRGNFRYREIENSNWRNRALGANEQRNIPQEAKEAEKKTEIPALTCDEYDGVPIAEDPRSSDTCMSISIGIEEKKTMASVEDFSIEDSIARLALESYLNVGNLKKRARPIDIHNVLNEDEQNSKISKESNRRK